MKKGWLKVLFIFLVGLCGYSHGAVTNYIWTGDAGDENFFNGNNWSNTVTGVIGQPPTGSTTDL